MDTQEVKRQYRLTQWMEIIRQCSSSGQTVSDWCAENNIHPKKYYYWLRRVRLAACEMLPMGGSDEPTILPVTLPNSVRQANPSVPAIAPVVLRLGAASVEIHHGASPELIAHTIKALTHVR